MPQTPPVVSLDCIAALPNLSAAWQAVRRKRGDPGLDGMTIQEFAANAGKHLQRLHTTILAQTYAPTRLRRITRTKRDGRQRVLGIPTVVDRVVQHALLQVLAPHFEPTFLPCSYGFRPGRSAHQAVLTVRDSLRSGCTWVVEADLEDFFDTLDWTLLRHALATRVPDTQVLELVHRFLQAGALRQSSRAPDPRGTPQGAVFSPLMSNVYLTPFDRAMTTSGYRLVRYGDDLVSLHPTQTEALSAFEMMQRLLEQQLQVRLHPTKTGVLDAQQRGFAFLSFWFQGSTVTPTPQAIARFRAQVQQRIAATRQAGGLQVIAHLNPLIRGWGEYFKIGEVATLYTDLDAWLAAQLAAFPVPLTSLASLRALYARAQSRNTSVA